MRVVAQTRPARPNATKTDGQLETWRRREPTPPAVAELEMEEDGEERHGTVQFK